MSSLNKVQLIGRLGADPELRTMPSGGSVVTLRIATSERCKDRQTGEQQERTEWTTVVFFGRIADVCAEYLRKGSQVYVEGSLRTRKWQDKQGNDRYTTEVVAQQLIMLGSPRAHGSASEEERTPPRGAATATSHTYQEPDFDDSIPF